MQALISSAACFQELSSGFRFAERIGLHRPPSGHDWYALDSAAAMLIREPATELSQSARLVTLPGRI